MNRVGLRIWTPIKIGPVLPMNKLLGDPIRHGQGNRTKFQWSLFSDQGCEDFERVIPRKKLEVCSIGRRQK